MDIAEFRNSFVPARNAGPEVLKIRRVGKSPGQSAHLIHPAMPCLMDVYGWLEKQL
jgi:hypothetical protein